jgi:predicted peptidase
MRTWIASVLSFFLPTALWAQDQLYDKGTFTHDGGELAYRLLAPARVEADKKYPLVVFLHGAGERGNDNEKQLIHGSALFTKYRDKFPAFVLFPQCPNGKRWVEVDWSQKTPHVSPKEASEPMKRTRALIDQLVKNKPIDTSRIYIMGLSMGGYGVWDFMARYPDVAAAAVPICGGADNTTAAAIKHIPVWAFHGAKDAVVWPIRSQSMVEELKKAGGTVRYTEYPSVGHNSWTPAFAEAELLPWLFAQQRK